MSRASLAEPREQMPCDLCTIHALDTGVPWLAITSGSDTQGSHAFGNLPASRSIFLAPAARKRRDVQFSASDQGPRAAMKTNPKPSPPPAPPVPASASRRPPSPRVPLRSPWSGGRRSRGRGCRGWDRQAAPRRARPRRRSPRSVSGAIRYRADPFSSVSPARRAWARAPRAWTPSASPRSSACAGVPSLHIPPRPHRHGRCRPAPR